MVSLDGGVGLELYVPGLLDAGVDPEAITPPSCAALESLLERAVVTPGDADPARHLCARFGVFNDAGDLPLAALTRAAHGESADDAAFALLAVVHLRVDRDRAYVVPLPASSVTEAEADHLQRLFSAQLAHWCSDLRRVHNALWTHRLQSRLALETVSLDTAAGRDAQACLPSGDDARQWMTLANELQMLLHAHPVNEMRQRSGQLMLNSVWLWGVGPMPRALDQPFTRAYSDRDFVRGLALLSGVPAAEPPPRLDDADLSAAPGRAVCIALFDAFRMRGTQDWQSVVEDLERDWFSPLHEALRSGGLQHATLWLGDGSQFRVVAKRAGRWRWRKPRPLRSYMKTDPL